MARGITSEAAGSQTACVWHCVASLTGAQVRGSLLASLPAHVGTRLTNAPTWGAVVDSSRVV